MKKKSKKSWLIVDGGPTWKEMVLFRLSQLGVDTVCERRSVIYTCQHLSHLPVPWTPDLGDMAAGRPFSGTSPTCPPAVHTFLHLEHSLSPPLYSSSSNLLLRSAGTPQPVCAKNNELVCEATDIICTECISGWGVIMLLFLSAHLGLLFCTLASNSLSSLNSIFSLKHFTSNN